MYHGSCHCGNVQFTVETPITQVIECNCSHCSRKGFLLSFVPQSEVQIEESPTPLTRYLFNKHAIKHDFCPLCGVQCFARGTNPADNSEVVAVNVRTLTDLDLSTLEVQQVDGKNM